MRMFDPVVVVTTDDTLDQALAIRGPLELFRLRVHLYVCCQKRELLEVLAGKVPESEYVVICSHGLTDLAQPSDPCSGAGLRFLRLVDEVDGRWDAAEVKLPPEAIRQVVRLPGRTVIATGCGTGREPAARAFLDAGCRAYIGATEPVDQDAGPLFTIAFFYHLLRHERDPSLAPATEEAAAALAAAVDTLSSEGTHLFRYYTPESFGG